MKTMLEPAAGWHLDVDQSSEWLFIRIHRDLLDCEPEPSLAEAVWSLAIHHRINRLVLEWGPQSALTSYLVGQLILLHKRVHLDGGVVRLCGLRHDLYRTLERMGLAERLPNYADREAAVMGCRPSKPR